MPNYGPGSPGFTPSPFDSASQATQGDVQNVPGTSTHTIYAVTGNNTQSSFIANNVNCAASVQTVITSVTLAAGKWDVSATCSASVNSTYKTGDSELAVIPSGGAVTSAYGAGVLAADQAATEAVGTVNAFVTLASSTVVQLVGNNVAVGGTNGARFTALATTTGGYTNATGIVAVPVV